MTEQKPEGTDLEKLCENVFKRYLENPEGYEDTYICIMEAIKDTGHSDMYVKYMLKYEKMRKVVDSR